MCCVRCSRLLAAAGERNPSVCVCVCVCFVWLALGTLGVLSLGSHSKQQGLRFVWFKIHLVPRKSETKGDKAAWKQERPLG